MGAWRADKPYAYNHALADIQCTDRHDMKRTTIRLLLMSALAAMLAAGCYSPEQEQAFRQFKDFDKLPPVPSAGPADAKGPPPLAENSTVRDYLAYAALNNPGLEAAFNRWKAALEMIPQAVALPDPQFTFKGFVVAQAMRDGDMRFMYELSQTFPWFGKLQLKGDVAAQEARGAFHRYEAARLDLFARVKDAYYEYVYLVRAADITDENLQRVKLIEEVARSKYQTATGSQPDIIRAQVELGKMENDLRSMRDMQAPVAAKLNAALNRPADAPLPRSAPPAAAAAPISEEQLLAWMEDSNPELKAMDADIAKERKAAELAGKDYFPDVMVGVEYDQMARSPDVSMSPTNPIAVMVSVNIPLWWEKYAAGVREAQARRLSAIGDKKEKANSLAADVKMESYNFRNAERKIGLYRDTLLPRAQQALKSTQASYQTGSAVFSDLIDTQRTLLEFQLNYERALADRQQALARLEALVGRPISAGGATGEAASQPATAPGAGG
jgi:outer membrane protein TolC